MRFSMKQYVLVLVLLLVFSIGPIALFFGFVIGNTSRQVTFNSVAQGRVAHYLFSASTNTGYLQMIGSPTLYTVESDSFMPRFDGISLLAQPYAGITFVYDAAY